MVNGWEMTGIINSDGAARRSPFTTARLHSPFAAARYERAGELQGDGQPPFGRSDGVQSLQLHRPERADPRPVSGSQGLAEFPPFPADMSKRNAFRPGFWNIDSACTRTSNHGACSFQFRFEAYNVFNHANLFILGVEPK